MNDQLQHFGIKRLSGRYPWGSGKDPYQHESWYFLQKVDTYREQGLSDTEIAGKFGYSTSKLRGRITWANKEVRAIRQRLVGEMHDAGENNVSIARKLDISEGTVRNVLLNRGVVKPDSLDATINVLKAGVANTGYLDVGAGVELQAGVSKEKMKAARQKLLEEGYYLHEIYLRQITDPTKATIIKVLSKEADLEVVKQNSDLIRSLESWSEDNGRTFLNIDTPKPIGWDKVLIRYAEEGGAEKDGLMELRRGADDLDLGDARYAQVRIQVGDSHYLKGMSAYGSEPFPKGVDVIFNTNKPLGTPPEKVLKPLKDNADNPFGATISRQKGALNIVNEEGQWDTWKGTLSSQMLSKQPLSLVNERLNATYKKLAKEYAEIESIPNPVLKKFLLEKYADGLDTSARMLSAQGLARTKNHVLLPFPEMQPTEVYAPNYRDGERVVLIRHPHGGIFEIPELTVNNKGPARETLGNAIDAIGIHPSVAKKLSGADFDGDTVLVIPNNNNKIKSMRSLAALKNFDPMKYQVDHQTISKARTQLEMGKVSNLITDMTIKGAIPSEIARAVKHSMVVIDAEKHKLDYKKSAEENGIAALSKRYQTHLDQITGKISRGASTIVSKSNSAITINQEVVYVTNPKTGNLNKKKIGGEKVKRMDIVTDARKLSSGKPVEEAYAKYANQVKALKNTAVKTYMAVKTVKRDPAAAKVYASEVKSLNEKLNTALIHAPRERQAQLLATKTYYKNLDYNMTMDEKTRLRSQAIAGARAKVIPGENKRKPRITLTAKEWAAIDANAISPNKLSAILKHADLDQVKKLATPRPQAKLSSAKSERARVLISKGYTIAEAASAIGVSSTVIRDQFKEELKTGG